MSRGTEGGIPSKACLTNVLIQDLQYVRGGTMHVLQDTPLWFTSPVFKHLLASFMASCTSKAQLQLCHHHFL